MYWIYILCWFIGFVIGGVVVQEIYIQIHKNDKTYDHSDMAIAIMYLTKTMSELEKEYRTNWEDNCLPYRVESIKRIIEYLK